MTLISAEWNNWEKKCSLIAICLNIWNFKQKIHFGVFFAEMMFHLRTHKTSCSFVFRCILLNKFKYLHVYISILHDLWIVLSLKMIMNSMISLDHPMYWWSANYFVLLEMKVDFFINWAELLFTFYLPDRICCFTFASFLLRINSGRTTAGLVVTLGPI